MKLSIYHGAYAHTLAVKLADGEPRHRCYESLRVLRRLGVFQLQHYVLHTLLCACCFTHSVASFVHDLDCPFYFHGCFVVLVLFVT